MSNTFKNKSRFSVLCEDGEPNNTTNNNKKQQKNTKEAKRFNITDSESNKVNNFKVAPQERDIIYDSRDRYDTRDRYQRNNGRNKFNYDTEKEKIKAEKIKEEQIKENLSINSFQNVEITKPSFLEKITTKKKEEVIEVIEEEQIKPGLVEIKYNKNTKKIDYRYGTPVSCYRKPTDESIVLQKLVENHEKWKAYYIQLWGEDEYEKIYRFPNYDYHYFDKLDEEYEMEQGKEDSDYYD